MVKITVIGSSSIDLVVTADKRPVKGETIIGNSFKTVPGGKGANQAVAAARLGGVVSMIGCVGDDAFGKNIVDNFHTNKVNTDAVKTISNCETGTAHIILADGDNSIIVVKSANDHITPEYVESMKKIIEESNIVLIQQEIPEETVEYVSELCVSVGTPLLLNPAPARPLSQKVIDNATYITPNEHEAEVLFGTSDVPGSLRQYPNKVFITEGKNGVRFFDGSEEILVPSYQVEVVDTTGAGDTFNAAFAVSLAEGKSLTDSIRFANRAASLSVTGFGAQGGMPTREEVEGNL